MTLEDAMDEDTVVSRPEAFVECRRHDHDPVNMVAALGDHPEYKYRDVLIWLGY